jgi:hypothetical protein
MTKWIWTVFCAYPDTPRGTYDEEIDVMAGTSGDARARAEEILRLEYDAGLKIRKIKRSAPVIEGRSIYF